MKKIEGGCITSLAYDLSNAIKHFLIHKILLFIIQKCNHVDIQQIVHLYYLYNNRASWSGGKGTSAEVPAITTSSPGHSGFNIPSAGALDPLRRDSWDCSCPDTRVIKKKSVGLKYKYGKFSPVQKSYQLFTHVVG